MKTAVIRSTAVAQCIVDVPRDPFEVLHWIEQKLGMTGQSDPRWDAMMKRRREEEAKKRRAR